MFLEILGDKRIMLYNGKSPKNGFLGKNGERLTPKNDPQWTQLPPKHVVWCIERQWCHKYTVCKYKYKYKYSETLRVQVQVQVLSSKYKYEYKYLYSQVRYIQIQASG